MSHADIRAFLKEKGPCLIGTVADHFGATTRQERLRIYWAVNLMCRDGLLSKSGKRKHQLYKYEREPAKQKFTPEELAARRKDQEAARRRAKGIKPRAVFVDEARKAAAERKAAREAQRAKPAPKPQQKPVKAPAPKPAARAPLQAIVVPPRSPHPTYATPPKPQLETSFEAEARGVKVELLPPPMALKPWEPLPKKRKRAA